MTDAKRILIVDDEELARRKIARYLGQAGREFVVSEVESGLAAVDAIAAFRPDIVFLDVQMPGLSGFEVLAHFEERPFLVVFQTAFDEHAIRAFEENACDYLLKPFTPERFFKALDRVLSRVADEAKLRSLETSVAERDGRLRRFAVKQGNQRRILESADVVSFVSRNHYTCAHTREGREAILELSIAALAERLDPSEFRQLHRNNIVNVSAVVGLSTARDGETRVELADGSKLPVSRSRRKLAKELFKSE